MNKSPARIALRLAPIKNSPVDSFAHFIKSAADNVIDAQKFLCYNLRGGIDYIAEPDFIIKANKPNATVVLFDS